MDNIINHNNDNFQYLILIEYRSDDVIIMKFVKLWDLFKIF